MGYPSETNTNLMISFTHDFIFFCIIILKFRTEHGKEAAVLYAKFQYDWVDLGNRNGCYGWTKFHDIQV